MPAPGNQLPDLPQWLKEFAEYLADEGVPPSRDTPANTSQDLVSERLTKVVSKTHSIFTHFPRDRNCKVRKRTKITSAPCRNSTGDAVPCAENFGDIKTADHKVLNEDGESRNNHRYAVVVQDLATQWIQSYPCKTKTSQETERGLRKFLEASEKTNHCTSTLHRSVTSGIGERAVRRIKEGTSAVLLQSDLDEKWWADSMECNCYLRDVQDIMADEKTLYERIFAKPFKGLVVPFGAMFEYFRPLQKTSQGSINLVRKSCQEYSSDTHWLQGESGREISWLQTLRSWKNWTRQRSTLGGSRQRK